MATIGTDCDFTIRHANVNGGVAVGFVVKPTEKVKIEREALVNYEGQWTDRVRVHLPVWLSDEARNPDGTVHTPGRAESYGLILALLAERTGLTVGLAAVTLANYRASLQSTEEEHGRSEDLLEVVLNNGGFNDFVSVDLLAYNNSVWGGPLTWETSYWRS